VVVIQNGKVVGEHYKAGFTQETRQQSWSMAKGFTQALVGILVGDGILSLDDTELMPEWKDDSSKAKITLGHMLHMASGLSFSENYADPWSDVDQMLFNQKDMGAFAASRGVAHAPGTQSIYASGTTNIVSKYMQAKMNAAGADYHGLPQTRLFNKIGMSSAIFEVDPAGTFIGSSYIYATPRDFARFGQLYLQDGIWDDERVLPEGWVAYTGKAAPNSGGKYGSHWSINEGRKNYPNLPEGIINLGGNDGQYIFVIPSKNAVIVRLGVMRWPATFEGEILPLIEAIYETL
jgi:CubicO group peptidase (beta-lactamase class C family)